MRQPWSITYVTVLVVAGLAQGFVNTAAGAGSLISLRALMLFGMPANMANGTNRLPVLAGSIAATLGFDSGNRFDRAAFWRIIGPTAVGALVGSFAATRVPEHAMRYVLIGVLFVVGLASLAKPRKKGEAELDGPPSRPGHRFWFYAALVFAGAYGGFLQVGVGLILLFALSTIGRYDIVRANALKTAVIAVFTVVALAVFALSGEVDFASGAVMCVGSVIGARLAVAFAMGHAESLKRFAVACDAIACAVLLYREWTG